jgi:hypothetical protein
MIRRLQPIFRFNHDQGVFSHSFTEQGDKTARQINMPSAAKAPAQDKRGRTTVPNRTARRVPASGWASSAANGAPELLDVIADPGIVQSQHGKTETNRVMGRKVVPARREGDSELAVVANPVSVMTATGGQVAGDQEISDSGIHFSHEGHESHE